MTERSERARRWIVEKALPLWSGAGIDPSGYGVWEALDLQGAPRRDLDKRFRVTLRQAFVFAKCETWFGAGTRDLASSLFDQAMKIWANSPTGDLPGLIGAGDEILTAPHDLYDLAFCILADAALAAPERETEPALLEALVRLKPAPGLGAASRGWLEARTGAEGPRRQNPHMHLFEAASAQVAAGREAYRPVAEECLALFRDIFLQSDYTVHEFFGADWSGRNPPGVEPGHMAEWVFLLEAGEAALGAPSGVDTGRLFARALADRGADGLLPDATDPPTPTRRFWPQTELLKAALAREAKGGDPAIADQTFDLIFNRYLARTAPGGWHDRFDAAGALLSETMPASTGYHIIPALRCYIETREGQSMFAD